jgi:predicted transport protein
MSDAKLFRIDSIAANEVPGHFVAVEKSLQSLLEKHLDAFLSVRFLGSEYTTGKTHGGRIDTLGLDENGCPVIIEYKRSLNENVINQGLFYLDWLLDHRGEFKLLVLECLGQEVAESIEWSEPRVLCIAGDFTKYDEHAVEQISRNIELIRYRRYGEDLLFLELVNGGVAGPMRRGQDPVKPKDAYNGGAIEPPAFPSELQDRFEALKAFLLNLGDDVQMKQLKNYIAFRRLKNFACAEVHSQKGEILVYAKVDPNTIMLEPEFTRDASKFGHAGTGSLEIRVRSDADLEKAKPLILRSYESS